MHRCTLLIVIALFACQTSYSSKFQNEEGGFPEPSVLLKNAQGTHQALASVGRLEAAMSCTAFLWKPADAKAEASALVVTNGHCVMPYSDRATTYEVWTGRPAPADWKLILNYFVDTPDARRTIGIQSIVYASMKSVDLALLELKISWAELEKLGLKPLPIATRAPRSGSPIRTVGVPLGDFPQEEQFLREAHCVEETRVSLVEWYWTWFDTHRNSCADIREGSSGSPVLDAQGAVYAVINTTSATGISDSCYLGNPCELQRPGAFMVANKNYAIPVLDLQDCFHQGTVTFGSACPLPSPDAIAYEAAPFIPTRPVDQNGKPISWQVKAPGAIWKFGAVGEVDCRDDNDYRAEPLPASELPQDNGVYLLCLQKPDADERFPTVVVLSIDTRPPTLKPQLSIFGLETGLRYEPIFQVPELSFYRVGHGPLASTQCESLPLSPYRRIPIPIASKDLPARICVQGEDHAGNPGPIFAYEVTAQDASAVPDRNMRTQPSRDKAKGHDVIRSQ
ncbi:S1 family peptidase [Oligoflexus tunisiensis]|uniref:S1 family peptidase n=1 Tax=Oligoflexus tunisiensis TaxID=708132 RepID=UPI00114D2CCC|nr:serine protease [Oligoflexus tunisiensis]